MNSQVLLTSNDSIALSQWHVARSRTSRNSMNSVNSYHQSHLAILIVWLVILGLASFAFAMHAAADLVTLSVMPEVPRKAEPIAVTFNLNNPAPISLPVSYDFYINNKKVKSGSALVAPLSTKKYTYIYLNDLELGNQASFSVRAATAGDTFEKVVSIPAYTPQVWSSFVSFASFSTSIMGSMSSMVYYQDSFLQNPGVQVGIVFAVVLLALLVFREITAAVRQHALVSLRFKFATVAAILLIIFVGMIFTRIVMILT